jgi:hypothetical protein
MIALSKGTNPIDFGVIRSKVKVTVTMHIIFDPKINGVLPLSQGNHVVKFGKDPLYRTKVIRKRPCCQKFFLTTGSFPHNNFSSVYWILTKLGHMIPLWKGKNPIYIDGHILWCTHFLLYLARNFIENICFSPSTGESCGQVWSRSNIQN